VTGPRLLLLGSLLLCLGCSGMEETPVFGPGPGVWAGYDPAWTVVHPTNGTERLLAACALASGEAWAVGTGGVVVHHVGERWLRERTGTGATLADVATDGRLVCAVGSGGAIIVREGGEWRREASGTSGALRAVAFAADGTPWAGGEGGALLRRTEEGWHRKVQLGASDVTALVALGDTMVVGYASGRVVGMFGPMWRTLGEFGGTGVLRLAVSPSGTLFAAADSLYRYDSGRWIALSGNADHRLAANDSLVFCGGVALRLDGSGDWHDPLHWIPWPGQQLAAVCAVGPAGALAVGLDGAFSWLRDGAWRRDPDGGCTGAGVPLADGTICALIDGQVIAWDDDRWRVVGASPVAHSDTLSIELVDGLDRSRLLFRANAGFVLTGASRQVVPPPPYRWSTQALLAPDGALVGADEEGLIAWDGQEWRREYINPDEGWLSYELGRTRDGQLFALHGRGILSREKGRWRAVARLAESDYISHVGAYSAAGPVGDSWVVLGAQRWLHWRDRDDSVQNDWRPYEPPRNDVWIWVSCEAAGVVYALEQNANRVLGLRFAGPETGEWSAVTGPLPDRVQALRVEPDGSITAFAPVAGRVWRYPARPLI